MSTASPTREHPAEGGRIHVSGQFTARHSAAFTLFACALFIVLGIVTTLLGPILPLLSARWSISTVQAGSLFFWQFIASTLGTLVSGAILAKRSFKLAVLLGVGLSLLGVAALAVVNWNLGRYAIACYGLGLGTALPAINLAVADANRNRRAASVSLLNFSWGIGALAGPKLLQLTHNLETFLLLLSALVTLGLLGSAISPMPRRSAPDQNRVVKTVSRKQLWSLVPLIALSMFLFCGVENAVAGWAATLALPSFGDAFRAANANVAFWAFFLAGRALAPVILRYFSEAKLLFGSIVFAAMGVLAFYFAAHVSTILLACALAGLGVGPGFPLLISRVSELIGSGHPATTICFAFAGIGGAILPTLVGIAGGRLSQPRAGLLLPFMGLLLLLPVARLLQNRPR